MANYQTVLGTDGVAPSYDPDGKWMWISIEDMFSGNEGNNKIIPKVGDYVIEPESFTVYIVAALDYNTYLPTLEQTDITAPTSITSISDKISSPTLPVTSNTYRLYYDNNTSPASVSVDARLVVYSNRVYYAKLFKGTNIYDSNSVISVNYDSSGNVAGDYVPVVSVHFDNTNNFYAKIVPTFNTNYALKNGDSVTLVLYNSDSSVVSVQVLTVVEVTGFVQASGPRKYITGLSLDSPFMSDTVPSTLQYPVNLDIKNLDLVGVVSYSDATKKYVPVAPGGGFYVYGIEQFNKSELFQPTPLILKYVFGEGEGAVNNVTYTNDAITDKIDLISVPEITSYTFKLYCVPVYVNQNVGYQLAWFVLSLSRNSYFNVTSLINYSSNTNYNPKNFSYQQNVYASLFAGNVSTSLPQIYISSYTGVFLNDPLGAADYPYVVYQDKVNSPSVGFGLGLRAVALDSSYTNLDISQNMTDFNIWLSAVYYNNLPLINTSTEQTPPTPTHFEVYYNPNPVGNNLSSWIDGMLSDRYMIQQWNTPITLRSVLSKRANIIIKFLYINGTTNSVLGISSMLIY